jgi:NAD(P)-dependent dehydrogenase (short-subunit alcohol dehydrogenase family)
MKLAGHHAVVTGGGTGIGAAIARALAAEGAKLTLVGRRRDKLEAVKTSLCAPAKAGAQDGLRSGLLPSQEHIHVEPADVTDRTAVDACFDLARRTHGPITILVNNAGAVENAPFARATTESWRAMMAVNLDAVFHCTQAAFGDISTAASGRIVTIASTAGLKGYNYSSAYVAAKHGAVGLMHALAVELAGTNATANAVCPGFTETEIIAEAVAALQGRTGRSEAEVRARFESFNPQGRLVTPEEVASAVLWLCLPESRSMNGQAIAVAGGEVM